MIDNDTNKEFRNKFNPEGSNLRLAQLRMLKMLKFIDKVCNDNGLTYWLDSGTLLGAKRHGGFIPWDDDTDICMPRRDAKRFREIMLKQNPSNEFVLQCRATDPGYFGAWCILRDTKTEYIQNSKMHNMRKYRGLQVDIFEVDDHCIEPIRQLIARYQHYLINKPLDTIDSVFLAKCIALPSYYILAVIKMMVRFISPKRDYCIKPLGVVWKHMQIINIYPLTRAKFEDGSFLTPGNADAYLTDMYGDWEVVPQNIETHNVEFIFK